MTGQMRTAAMLLLGTSALSWTTAGLAQTTPAAGPVIAAPADPQTQASTPTSAAVPTSQNAAPGLAGDIIVTAQKRSQRLNDVGVTITAATGDQLARVGVSDTADLVKVVPGLTFTPTAYNTPVYTLRGIGFYETSLAAAPAVSVYTDEVALAFPAMTQGAALDVERVEVLKGPQGTLYGQNSTGGAINYIAAKPTATWQAGLDVGFSRFNTADFGGFVSGPLTPTLGFRAALRTVQGGEWQRSTTRRDELGQTDQLVGRILIDWQPASGLRFELNLNGWQDKSDTTAGQVIQVAPAVPALASPNLANYPAPSLDARDADWTAGKSFRANDRFYNISLRADYDVSPLLTLTSISAYQHLRQYKPNDVDATSGPVVDFISVGSIKAVSQEVRAALTAGRVNAIIGGNYSHARIVDNQPGDFLEASVNQPVPPIPRFRYATPVSNSTLETYAGFGNLDIKVVGGLSLIAGLRYTESRNRFRGCTRAGDVPNALVFTVLQPVFRGALGLTPTTIPINVGDCITLQAPQITATGVANAATVFLPALVDRWLDQHNLSIRGGVNYKLASGALLYGSFNRGYKAGGFPVLVATLSSQLQGVTQERVNAYEAGVKLPLFDGRVQLNAAGFYYDYLNKQIRGRISDPIFGLLETLINVPKSRVIGGEAEIQARVLPGLDFSASATYVNTKVQRFTGFDVGATQLDLAGSRFPYTPKLTAVADVQYSWDVGGGHQLFVGASGRHNSTAYASFTPQALTRLRPYTLLDLRAGFQQADGGYRLSIWGRNVTNQYYWNSVFRSTDTTYRQPARPVTYGVSFSARFGP